MSAAVCPNCGNALERGAKACVRCGQAVQSPGSAQASGPAAGRELPLVPLVILAGGVLALVLVLLLARSNPPAGEVLSGTAAPTPERAAAAPAAPASPRQLAAAPAATIVAAPAVAAAPTPRSRPTPPIEKVYECRAGAVFGVDPEEALITVNGKTIGKADDWDDAGGGQKYLFGGPGTYFVKLSLEQYRTAWIKIVVRPQAEEEYASVDLELKKLAD